VAGAGGRDGAVELVEVEVGEEGALVGVEDVLGRRGQVVAELARLLEGRRLVRHLLVLHLLLRLDVAVVDGGARVVVDGVGGGVLARRGDEAVAEGGVAVGRLGLLLDQVRVDD